MVGYLPDYCPFCGASKQNFLTAEECSTRFTVVSTPVNDRVSRLNSVPALGFEHAAYRIETTGGPVWVDCPSCFDDRLQPVKSITFTHHHFLGASNLYRDQFSARVQIHRSDSAHEICRGFTFDRTFPDSYVEGEIEAFHVNGHTPGFTFYIFKDTLLICDYVFYTRKPVRFNPFGPGQPTVEGGRRIAEILGSRQIKQVCGVNYVAPYSEWRPAFDTLLQQEAQEVERTA
ncbi:MAG: MBL fold metallo-hydrolase [Chloroflexi bacterium]|nr:MBL fold metallo-hydrolase [Chloroflexota bacterium]